jgi:hypothetical protein
MVLMKSKEQPMNKPLTSVELSLATPPVTKRQRLQRFADVIRSGRPCPLHLFINLEYCDAGEWKYLSHPGSPFALAAQDNVLYAAGFRSGNVSDAQRFFELSREELTEFSCVCGGSINSNEMAERIERIAARSAT